MRCPFCKERIAEGCTVCPECHNSFAIAQPEFCPICHGVWREGNFYCRYCGSRLLWMMDEGMTEEEAQDLAGVKETEEGLVLVGVLHRAMASVFDCLLIMTIIGFTIPQVANITFAWGELLTASFWYAQRGAVLTVFGVMVAYYTVFEGILGFTPGKLMAQIRVVQSDGSPVGLPRAFLRNLLRIIDIQFFYLLGAFLVWKTPWQQRCGDLVAKTLVVRL